METELLKVHLHRNTNTLLTNVLQVWAVLQSNPGKFKSCWGLWSCHQNLRCLLFRPQEPSGKFQQMSSQPTSKASLS